MCRSQRIVFTQPATGRVPGMLAQELLERACCACAAQVNKEKHELRGRLLALQGKATEAAQEVGFLGAQREQEMRDMGRRAAAAAAQQAGSGAAPGSGTTGLIPAAAQAAELKKEM
jgi:hypothetical protein